MTLRTTTPPPALPASVGSVSNRSIPHQVGPTRLQNTHHPPQTVHQAPVQTQPGVKSNPASTTLHQFGRDIRRIPGPSPQAPPRAAEVAPADPRSLNMAPCVRRAALTISSRA